MNEYNVRKIVIRNFNLKMKRNFRFKIFSTFIIEKDRPVEGDNRCIGSVPRCCMYCSHSNKPVLSLSS